MSSFLFFNFFKFKRNFLLRRNKILKRSLRKANQNQKFFYQKPGFTITEVLVTVGIIGLLVAAGYQGYLYHYDVTGKLSALQQLGTQAIHRMQTCVEQGVLNTGKETFEAVAGTTWQGCDTKKNLSLQSCLDCKEPQINTSKLALCMEITQGRFTQCVAYRIGSIHRPYKATVNDDQGAFKVCGKRPDTKTAWTAAGANSVWPYRPCDSHKDCCDANTDSACAAKGRECRTFTGKCDLTTGNGGCG